MLTHGKLSRVSGEAFARKAELAQQGQEVVSLQFLPPCQLKGRAADAACFLLQGGDDQVLGA